MNNIEKALIEKCKVGDIDAFEKLIFSYQKKVFNLCYRYLENQEDASEAAQEVFIKIFKSIITFKGDSQFSTWVYKVAVSTCIDELRKRKKHHLISIDDNEENHKIEIIDTDASPHDQYENSQAKREIIDAISKLSQEHKMVVILRDIQGFSYDEIAQMIGVPLGTVKSRIKRARETIKEYLEKGNFFEKASSN